MKFHLSFLKKYIPNLSKICLSTVIFVSIIHGLPAYDSLRIFMAKAYLLSDNYIATRNHTNLSSGDYLPPNYNYDGMLARAKNAGYNCVYCEFIPFSDQPHMDLLYDAILKAEKFKLKLIPAFSINSSHGSAFGLLNDWSIDPSIVMNVADVTINDNASGTLQNQLDYQGIGWAYVAMGLAGQYMNDDHESSTINSVCQVKFSGCQIKVYAKTQNNLGIAAISIDGGTETFYDQYSVSPNANTLIYKSPLLSNGNHYLKLRVTGLKNAASSGNIVSIDYIQVGSSGNATAPFLISGYFSTKIATLLSAIKTAYEKAKLNTKSPFVYNKSLDYIFFNFDEGFFQNIYSVPSKSLNNDSWTTLCAYTNPDDQNYVLYTAPHKNTATAFRELYANNINSLLSLVQKNLYSTTKMMIFADLFDPQFSGSWTFNTFISRKNGYPNDVDVKLSPNDGTNTDVLDCPGLDPDQIKKIKENLILCPWMYRIDGTGMSTNYNADNTFQYFTSKGFKTIFVSSLGLDKGRSTINQETFSMLNEYTSKAKKSTYNIVGCFAAIFPCCMDESWNKGNCFQGSTNCRCGPLQSGGYWDNRNGVYLQPIEFSTLEQLAQKMGFYPNNIVSLPQKN